MLCRMLHQQKNVIINYRSRAEKWTVFTISALELLMTGTETLAGGHYW